jgi:hypothetical protein
VFKVVVLRYHYSGINNEKKNKGMPPPNKRRSNNAYVFPSASISPVFLCAQMKVILVFLVIVGSVSAQSLGSYNKNACQNKCFHSCLTGDFIFA